MMKSNTCILIFLLFFPGLKLQAQFSNLIIFTQEKEPFTVIMNGIQQNPVAETNVKITGLNAPNCKVKIRFQNQALAEIDKTVYLRPETESTHEILRNKKGVYVLRMMNSVPLDEAEAPAAGQEIYVYTTTPRISTSVVSQTTTVNTGLPGGVSVSTTTMQTTTNVGLQEANASQEKNENHHLNEGRPGDHPGPGGCPRPMDPRSFDEALQSISSKTFASSKLTIAKEIVGSNCLRCKQVKEIMQLFTYESDRLEFAKFAYKHTWDVRNYFILNDAFQFESSIDDLNRFINKKD